MKYMRLFRKIDIEIEQNIKKYKTPIESVVKLVFGKLSVKPPAGLKIKFKIASNPKALKAMEGVGGYCPSKKSIQISIDANHPKFKRDPVGALSRSLAHELFHALRFATGVSSPNGTMLDCVVDEGLADCYVHETLGRYPVWNKRLTPDKAKKLLSKFDKIKTRKVSDALYEDWFIKGSKTKNIPRWAGYALGRVIIKRYLFHCPQKRTIDLVGVKGKLLVNH